MVDMDHQPQEPQQQPQEPQQAQAQAAEGGASAGVSSIPDVRRPRANSTAAQSALGRLSESPATVDAHHLHAPVWAGEGKGDEGKKPHAYLPPASQRGDKKEEDDTWWMRRRSHSGRGQQLQEGEEEEGDDEAESESLVARLKQHKARAAAAAASGTATTTVAGIPSTEQAAAYHHHHHHHQQQQQQQQQEEAPPTTAPSSSTATTTTTTSTQTYTVSVAPWGLQQHEGPSAATVGCSLFRCGPSASSSSSASAPSFVSYRIHITSPGQGQGQEEEEEEEGSSGRGSRVCVKRYSELLALHELWLSRGLIPAASPARRLFPPKAAPPLSRAGAAGLARARARRLQAYFECLLNEEATGMAQSPLFWTMFAGSGRMLVL